MAWTPAVADGSKIYLDTGAAWSEIRGARNFQLGAPTKAKIDKTELRDTVKKYAGGKMEFGDATFTVMLDPTDTVHEQIYDNGNTPGSTDRIYVEWNGGGKFTLYTGYFIAPSESFEQDAMIEGQVTFVLDEVPVFSTTAPAAA